LSSQSQPHFKFLLLVQTMKSRFALMVLILVFAYPFFQAVSQERTHPRLMADQPEIDTAKQWIKHYAWYRELFETHKKEIDAFIAHGPIYVSPLKQTYVYDMYTCPKHHVELMYEEFKPFEHRCPVDTNEVYKGGKYDMAWAGWYNRLLASHLVWMGLLYNVYGGDQYAEAGKTILTKFADLYLKYPTENTILGPAHVFFGTLSESFWGVDMAYGYDLLFNYKGFDAVSRQALKDSLFYPLAHITQLFPETASNRQNWYNNVSAAVGFLYGDQALIDFAMIGRYGFKWQLGSALPESGFWAEWSGYHYVALRGMIHLAEMARHNGLDLYHMEIAGRSMKKMFDTPFQLIKPNFEFPRCKDSGGGSLLEYAPFYEVGYAVYRDPRYLSLLNRTHLQRGTQVVGESSALGKAPEPVTVFNLVPRLPVDTTDIYPKGSLDLQGNGFAVLRNEHPRTYLYLDYGILGGEHGHPDRLQMGYYADGRNWIVDPLNESYANPNLQLWFRQSIAHNTLVVDQTTQTWTNGHGNFFGALPLLQVASGSSATEYAGIKLTRTLLQSGEYFLDLFDAAAPEPHIYDLPLHGFGSVKVSGLSLEAQPIDLFGNRPGIPGYDQLTGISAGRTDSSWQGLFTDNGKYLAVHVLGEQGTEVFSAMTPSIGGFYKQMVSEQVPMPMVMSRRFERATRFASVIEACAGRPSVRSFVKGEIPGSYIVRRDDGDDFFHVDVGRSSYYVVREQHGATASLAGFNVQNVRFRGADLLSSVLSLSRIQCVWNDTRLDIMVPERFGRMSILAPQALRLTVNGMERTFRRDGGYIIIEQQEGVAVTVTTPCDTLLFAGRRNAIKVRIANYGPVAVKGSLRLALSSDWKQRMHSQLEWWGGIVNLVATNKGPVERTIRTGNYREDAAWIDGMSSDEKTIPPGGMDSVMLVLNVPNDAAPVTYPASITFGGDTVRMALSVRPPVTAHMMLPNGEQHTLWIDLTNHTPDRLAVSTRLILDPAWRTAARKKWTVDLAPFATRRIPVPVQLEGYTTRNQLYPIRLQTGTDQFHVEIVHDFYVGVAHFASHAPTLNGSWQGWNRKAPMLIDTASQIARLLFGNQPWHGRHDLSAQVYVMYDNRFLYVGADVTDDSVITHWDFPRMSYPWDTDCMDVVLDVRTDCTEGHDPPTPGLFRHLSLAEYRQTDFGAVAWQTPSGPLLPKPNLVPGAETYFHRTGQGYAMFVRYPLSSLPGIVAKPGYKIGFDVAFNDNDGTNYRKNEHIWAGFNQNQAWWDMGTIGALLFR
jgi:hypothetical protein